MGLFNRLSEWRKARESAKHVINLQSIHYVDHNGSTLEVAKSDKGHLVIFPYAKKVSARDIVDFMNRTNADSRREIEWRGYVDPEAFRDVAYKSGRLLHRVIGPFEIDGPDRNGPLRVMRKVRKPMSKESTTPLEEALLLLKARRLKYKCELPVAVFMGRGKFPEMLFTTHLRGKTTESVPADLAIGFNDRVVTHSGIRPIFFDAEYYRDAVPDIVKQANELRRTLKKL